MYLPNLNMADWKKEPINNYLLIAQHYNVLGIVEIWKVEAVQHHPKTLETGEIYCFSNANSVYHYTSLHNFM